MLHQQRVIVSYEFPVFFGRGVFSPQNRALVDAVIRREPARLHRALFVVEQEVALAWPNLLPDIKGYMAAHASALSLAGPVHVMSGGEACKNDPEAPLELASVFDQARLDRQSFVVVVGGGALQDLVGYAAAITHRGLRVVRVPTTVLSQNDSGVGVKNGVNAWGKKNFLGTFAPPFAVLVDFDFLRTLDRRDQIAGMAEAVKVSLIKDRSFFEWLEVSAPSLARFEEGSVSQLVQRCAVLHMEHIAGGGDPFELGSSRPLDFGHWAAHKLETLSNFELRHGEAVSVGIALDTRYSVELGLLPAAEGARVIALLEGLGLPTWVPVLDLRGPDGRREVLDGAREFREHLGGDLTLMMLDALGKGREVTSLDEAAVERSMDWLRARAGRQTKATRSSLPQVQSSDG